jgi:hypothetical protein
VATQMVDGVGVGFEVYGTAYEAFIRRAGRVGEPGVHTVEGELGGRNVTGGEGR